MTRQEYLEHCLICTKREHTMKKGIVCSLTMEHADFENKCENFEKDREAELAEMARKMAFTGDHKSGDSLNYEKNKDQGVLIIFASVILSVVLLAFLGLISLTISVGLLWYGISTYRRGVEQEKVFKHIQETKLEKEQQYPSTNE